MMLVRAILLVLLPVLAAGCTSGEPGNPNLLAPKVVVDVLPNGEATVFIHSAFGERRYDSILLAIDNQTVATGEQAFSVEHRVNQTRFFLDTQAISGESRFRFQGNFDLEPDTTKADRVDVAFLSEEGDWSEPRTYSLPFVQILDRPEASE